MSKFEDKMYEFITHEDNFHMAKEIVEMMPNVEERLIDDFWLEVKDRLTTMDEDVKWKFEYKVDYINIFPRTDFAYHFSFVELFANAWIALWITEKGNKNNALDILENHGLIEGMKIANGMKIAKRDTVAVYKNYPNSIRSDFFLRSIIPSRRQGKVDEVANWIWSFITEFEASLSEMNNHGK